MGCLIGDRWRRVLRCGSNGVGHYLQGKHVENSGWRGSYRNAKMDWKSRICMRGSAATSLSQPGPIGEAGLTGGRRSH